MNNQKIQELAIANGFKLKEQPDGTLALNPYVFEFARTLLAARSAEMKIPKGWPTEEMITAGIKAQGTPDHLYSESFERSDMAAQFIAMLAAAPTPPAQDVGPVAWMIEIEVTRGVIQRMFHGHNAIGDYRKSFPDATSRPLYTDPQPDKLRKEAEEVVRLFEIMGSTNPRKLAHSINDLRAALEGR